MAHDSKCVKLQCNGIDFIDDDYHCTGFRAAVANGMTATPAFFISLTYMLSNGDLEGVPLQIAWSYAARRYQEVTTFHTNSERRSGTHRIDRRESSGYGGSQPLDQFWLKCILGQAVTHVVQPLARSSAPH